MQENEMSVSGWGSVSELNEIRTRNSNLEESLILDYGGCTVALPMSYIWAVVIECGQLHYCQAILKSLFWKSHIRVIAELGCVFGAEMHARNARSITWSSVTHLGVIEDFEYPELFRLISRPDLVDFVDFVRLVNFLSLRWGNLMIVAFKVTLLPKWRLRKR